MTDLNEPAALPAAEITADGLRLRPWRIGNEADLAAYLRGVTDPDFRRWNTPLKPVVDLASAEESMRSHSATQEEGTSVSCCVTDEATGEILGNISLHKVERVFRSAKTGYWVLPEARGRRVATRALTLLSRWAFPTLGLHRIELDHAIGHDASCRIAEKCGYPYEGTLRGAMFESGCHDAFRDSHLHARLATDPDLDDPARSRF